jgi:hypothetical protein
MGSAVDPGSGETGQETEADEPAWMLRQGSDRTKRSRPVVGMDPETNG